MQLDRSQSRAIVMTIILAVLVAFNLFLSAFFSHSLAKTIGWGLKGMAAGLNRLATGDLAFFSKAVKYSAQASSLQQLTASLQEISSQTNTNVHNADQANKFTQEAKSNAESGNGQMGGMLGAMDEINASSNNISKIIKVIDDIAFQTNILALNAAVEAARAGSAGKGFAFVADEVRNLAAKSANAAKETTDMIEGSMSKVEVGTKIANTTADTLKQIADQTEKAASSVNAISVSSNAQASSIYQINQAISLVSEVVQTNAATAEECAAASAELSNQAIQMKKSVSVFKIKAEDKVQDQTV